MIEEFSGTVKSAEIMEPSADGTRPVGLLLRPIQDWQTPIVVGAKVKLVLPDGSSYLSRIKGGEIMTSESPGILVDFISEIDNSIPQGTELYVLTA